MEKRPASLGSIIGLKPEYREPYIVLHRNTFPRVLEQIHRSNICDYSIFLQDGLLFSHMLYNGSDYDQDMRAMGADPVTRDWWKLTDPMQEPFPDRKDGEWWLQLEPGFQQRASGANGSVRRMAFRFPSGNAGIDPGNFPDKSLPDNLTLSVFRHNEDHFVYLETAESFADQAADLLRSAFGIEVLPEPMQEVFHTSSRQAAACRRKKVFVTGCFDMLHSGHIAFLQEAASFGDLYVSIGSDANVEHLKGRYPVNSQDERKYMIDALSCVTNCRINSGWGIIDFEKELRDIMPDTFVVNEDGHTPTKQALCKDLGIEYKVLRRIPHADLPVRSTTALRTECTIPFRIDLAGGWLDQPFVSKYHPGSVLTISIEPTIEFNERSGMSTSTRRKAIELWRTEIPHGDAEQLARLLFSYENPPGTQEVSGSQDSLGIVLPGLNKLDYDGHYWPRHIHPVQDEGILTWIEKNLYLVTLGPRVSTYSVIDNTRISPEGAAALASATEDCWKSILQRDIVAFGDAFRRSFEAQVAMFPNMVDTGILETIEQYRDQAWGWKLSGAGGGGYLILVAREPIEGAMQIKIRRKNSL